jgi:hypothetical protein
MKIHEKAVEYAQTGRSFKQKNVEVKDGVVWFYGKAIISYVGGVWWINAWGWTTRTMQLFFKAVPGVMTLVRCRGTWILNGVKWDGTHAVTPSQHRLVLLKELEEGTYFQDSQTWQHWTKDPKEATKLIPLYAEGLKATLGRIGYALEIVSF